MTGVAQIWMAHSGAFLGGLSAAAGLGFVLPMVLFTGATQSGTVLWATYGAIFLAQAAAFVAVHGFFFEFFTTVVRQQGWFLTRFAAVLGGGFVVGLFLFAGQLSAAHAAAIAFAFLYVGGGFLMMRVAAKEAL